MNELAKLGLKYGTDKGTKHHYLDIYYDLFKDKRESIQKVLEIGVAEGAGLRMLKDFFPNAIIYGIDNQDNRIFEEVGIKVFKADQSNRDQLLEVWDEIIPGPNNLDIVIEDGSHIPEHQYFTANTLVPLLKEGAIYIIEDVDGLSAEPLFEKLSKFNPIMIKVGMRHDDRLLIIKK